MEIDYGPYLYVSDDGEIWWSVETAIKLVAGFVPVKNVRSEQGTELRPQSSQNRADERSILASINSPLPNVDHPDFVARDGERYVRARDLLRWVHAYGEATQSPFAIPLLLTQAVKRALSARSVSQSAPFDSLVVALEGWFDRDLLDLPQPLRDRLERNFFPMPWDKLNPAQRRSVAEQWDFQHDPVTEAKRERGFNAFCKVHELESQVREWELVATPSALDRAARDDRLAKLQLDLANARKALAAIDEPRVPVWKQKLLADQNAGTRPDEPKHKYIPYAQAMNLLRERLNAKPEELAAWIWMTPHEGCIRAFLNANELHNPPRFFFGDAIDGEYDYVDSMMGCWFIAEEVRQFQPVDRFVTGRELHDRWSRYPDIRVEAFVKAKIEESRLNDFHPTFGCTQWSHPEESTFPPREFAFFDKSRVEQIEREELGEPPPMQSKLGVVNVPVTPEQQSVQRPTETKIERLTRIAAAHANLSRQKVRNPTEQIALQEDISTSRVNQLLRQAKALSPLASIVSLPKAPRKSKRR